MFSFTLTFYVYYDGFIYYDVYMGNDVYINNDIYIFRLRVPYSCYCVQD